MIQIRAGILRNLKLEFSAIHKDIIKDIICKNSMRTILETYAIIDYMEENNFFNSDVCIDPIDPSFILGQFAGQFLKYLLTRYTLEQIYVAFALYIDIGIIFIPNNNLDCWKNVSNNIGFKKENYVRNKLGEVGIFIREIDNHYKIFNFGDTTIKLNGKPDGVIEYSYGGIYKPGTVVEIKFKKKFLCKSNKNDDILQIVGYGVLFGTDVLYIRIDNYNNINISTYTYRYILEIWEASYRDIFKNCTILDKLFESAKKDEASLKKLLQLVKNTDSS